MGDYGRTSGTGGVGTAAITNDDEYTLDLPEEVNQEMEDAKIKNQMDERAY